MTMIRRTLLLGAALVLPAPASASARADDLWATVNVCDTAAAPNTVGIRGSMPGLRRRATLRMRYRVQYLDAKGRWRPLRSATADSGWRRVATRAGGRVEAGWSVAFAPPPAGGAIVLRGVVSFQWRRGHRAVRRARRITEGGHASSTADPPGYSAATCRIA